jgi:hypothetical protein
MFKQAVERRKRFSQVFVWKEHLRLLDLTRCHVSGKKVEASGRPRVKPKRVGSESGDSSAFESDVERTSGILFSDR